MRVLFASSEIYPHVKIGGLGDVANALPVALKGAGVDIRLILPGYPSVIDNLASATRLAHKNHEMSNSMQLLKGVLPNGMQAYVIDAPHLYNRSGPYTDEKGLDWDDNHTRFSLLGYVAANISSYDQEWVPEIVHGQDWLCGLIPAYLKARPDNSIRSVITIHNMAYQGLFPQSVFDDLRLPSHFYATEGLEFYGKVGFLKAGLHYADAITAVSPTYAQEIQQGEQGCGLDGLLRHRSHVIKGILNGIDKNVWNPEADPCIAVPYNAKKLARKKVNKKALIREMGLKPGWGKMLFGVIGRMVPEKGFDLLPKAVEESLKQGHGLVVLGKGNPDIEQEISSLAHRWPQQVFFYAGYDEALAHRIIAGADALIVPSRFEPCGLVQMYAMRYGTLPVVHRTGGLADTVSEEEGSGFIFERTESESLAYALLRVSECFRKRPLWRKRQRTAMEQDFSWDKAAHQYVDLYQNLVRDNHGGL